MSAQASEAQIDAVAARLAAGGFEVRRASGDEHAILTAHDGPAEFDPRAIRLLPGVSDVCREEPDFVPASGGWATTGLAAHGDGAPARSELTIVAGPCAVESEEQMEMVAAVVAEHGGAYLRGGAFKPRSSPYSFQGLGQEGLRMLREAGDRHGLRVITEVMRPAHVDLTVDFADVLQIGARNMQNFELLREVGRAGRPVLLKRGFAATIDEWLMSAEYIIASGNPEVILCERGIRTFETSTRNTLDLSAVPVVQSRSHLPVFVDPSHGTGVRSLVTPLARAAAAVGADGIMVEIHPDPALALSDGPQSLYLDQFSELVREVRSVAEAVGRTIAKPVAPKTPTS